MFVSDDYRMGARRGLSFSDKRAKSSRAAVTECWWVSGVDNGFSGSGWVITASDKTVFLALHARV